MFYVRRALAFITGFLTITCGMMVLGALTTIMSLHASRFAYAIDNAHNEFVGYSIAGALLLWLTVSLWQGRAWRVTGAPKSVADQASRSRETSQTIRS